jgi:chemotaxis protein MotB
MAKRKQKEEKGPETPGWLLTFTGLMILIMAFFVYLVTNASLMDERKIRLAVGSLMGTFGMGPGKPDTLGTEESTQTHQPGPFPDDDDMAPLKEMLWDDVNEDLQFVSNRFVQIFSVNTVLLFPPGETGLTAEGQSLLRQVAPTLREVDHPVLIAGHTSMLRDEFDLGYTPSLREEVPDPSWSLSLYRALSVFQFLLDQGVPAENLRMEGTGRFDPRGDPLTPQGRRENRRVDFVLDRRAESWMPMLDRPATSTQGEDFMYRDFIFRFPDEDDPETRRP